MYFSNPGDDSMYACAEHRDEVISTVAATPYGRGHVYYIPVGEPANEIERKRTERINRLRAQRWARPTRDN